MKRFCVGIGLGFLTFACSGKYDVGFEPVAGSAGTGSQNDGGSTSAGGSSSVAGTGTAGGSVVAGSGGAMVGDNDQPVGGRCGFSPTAKVAPPALVSSAELAARVYHFLEAGEAPSDLMLPRTPSAAWAAQLATQILDGHAATQTEVPGLVRFLATWLPVNANHSTAASALKWGAKLAAADATLATLLSEPTGDAHRFGIITEPDVLSARNGISGRGTWMLKALFCNVAPPPPPDLPPLESNVPSGTTHRQALEASLGTNAACQACHALIDPGGDSLEHFDDAGNYRTLDNGAPVDASARFMSPPMEFEDFATLAPQLAVSCEVAQCIGGSIFQDALTSGLGTANVALQEGERNAVANQFANADFSIRALVKAIVTSPSFVR